MIPTRFFDFIITYLSGEREHVQKKTFTKWVNSHLCRVNCKVTDLYTDLRDGKLLLKLLEILSTEKLVSFPEIICVNKCKFCTYLNDSLDWTIDIFEKEFF